MTNTNYFRIIPQIKLESGGLRGSSHKPVHFRQGDLDGACGMYSVAMCLSILGVFDSDKLGAGSLEGMAQDERRLVQVLNDYGLYRQGLTARQIVLILNKNFSKHVKAKSHSNDNSDPQSRADFAQRIINNVDNGIPTVLMISYPGEEFGHWIVVVGYQHDENDYLKKFLCLDPGVPSPRVSYWNGILTWSPKSNLYQYLTQDGSYKVALEEMITIDYSD